MLQKRPQCECKGENLLVPVALGVWEERQVFYYFNTVMPQLNYVFKYTYLCFPALTDDNPNSTSHQQAGTDQASNS